MTTEKEYVVRLTKVWTQEFTKVISKVDGVSPDNAADETWEAFNRQSPLVRTHYTTEVLEVYKKQP